MFNLYYLLIFLLLLPALVHSRSNVNDPPVDIPENITTLKDFEQNHLDRTVDTSLLGSAEVKTQNEIYRPENGQWFVIKTLWLPEKDLHVAQLETSSFNDPEFIKVENGIKYYRLLVHPESEKFYEMGFRNIYLATGHDSDYFEDMEWIKEVVSKSPPW